MSIMLLSVALSAAPAACNTNAHQYDVAAVYDQPTPVNSEYSFETPYCFKGNYQEVPNLFVGYIALDFGFIDNSPCGIFIDFTTTKTDIVQKHGIIEKYRHRCCFAQTVSFHKYKYI